MNSSNNDQKPSESENSKSASAKDSTTDKNDGNSSSLPEIQLMSQWSPWPQDRLSENPLVHTYYTVTSGELAAQARAKAKSKE